MCRVETSVKNILQWASSNCLKINPTKTEVTLFGSRRMLDKAQTTFLKIGEDHVPITSMIKYLGVHLDGMLTLHHHIQVKCAAAINNIRRIRQIRSFINSTTAKMLASALVLCHLDYANSVLCELPAKSLQKLQRVQNWAAKVVLCRSKYDSSTESLRQLHWLHIKHRIDFKILCLVYKCIHGTAPSYLCELIKVKTYTRNTRAAVSRAITLEVPFVRKSSFAGRSFSVYGPKQWNSLPAELQLTDSFVAFRRQLKTYLFTKAFI